MLCVFTDKYLNLDSVQQQGQSRREKTSADVNKIVLAVQEALLAVIIDHCKTYVLKKSRHS